MWGGAGAARSDDTTVNDTLIFGSDTIQLHRNREMGSVSPSREQAGIMQYSGRGADGGEPASDLVLSQYKLKHPRIGAQMFHPGSTRQKDTIE